MGNNHTHTAVQTVSESLPPGHCKAAILFCSHTFHGTPGWNWIPLNKGDDDKDDDH